jgi:hypothetical protein
MVVVWGLQVFGFRYVFRCVVAAQIGSGKIGTAVNAPELSGYAAMVANPYVLAFVWVDWWWAGRGGACILWGYDPGTLLCMLCTQPAACFYSTAQDSTSLRALELWVGYGCTPCCCCCSCRLHLQWYLGCEWDHVFDVEMDSDVEMSSD